MNKENILLGFSIVFSVLIFSFAIFTTLKEDTKVVSQEESTKKEDPEEEEFRFIEDIQTPEVFTHSTWIPAFDFNNGFESLQKHKDLFSTVNPVFYGVNPNGSLIDRKPNQETLNSFMNFCNTNNIQILPTIGSFDYNIMESILQSETYLTNHITYILNEVDKYDYDGIDIDYEKIRSKEKTHYLKFLTELSKELNSREKLLSVTVFAKTKDENTDTLYVQDWETIGSIANQVRIMTYDYTLQTSTTPGPIGPITWINDVLKYAILHIPTEKIYLGIHLYGYLWKGEKASALTHSTVLNILKNTNIKSIHKNDISEGYAEYDCSDGFRCILYHQTKKGVQERISLAQKYKLAGITYWRIGKEGDLLNFD